MPFSQNNKKKNWEWKTGSTGSHHSGSAERPNPRIWNLEKKSERDQLNHLLPTPSPSSSPPSPSTSPPLWAALLILHSRPRLLRSLPSVFFFSWSIAGILPNPYIYLPNSKNIWKIVVIYELMMMESWELNLEIRTNRFVGIGNLLLVPISQTEKVGSVPGSVRNCEIWTDFHRLPKQKYLKRNEKLKAGIIIARSLFPVSVLFFSLALYLFLSPSLSSDLKVCQYDLFTYCFLLWLSFDMNWRCFCSNLTLLLILILVEFSTLYD